MPLGFLYQPRKIGKRSQLRVNRFVAAIGGANSPGSARITWLGIDIVVLALAVGIADGMNRRQIKYIKAHFGDAGGVDEEKRKKLIKTFYDRQQKGSLATDQLLNAIYLTAGETGLGSLDKKMLEETILRYLV